jgi:DNA repair exonuclease SbcCD ATPase subunit
MSSSSSLSSARRRRVGAQQTVQNPPSSVRDVRGAKLQQQVQQQMQQQQLQQQQMQQQQLQQQQMQQQQLQQQQMQQQQLQQQQMQQQQLQQPQVQQRNIQQTSNVKSSNMQQTNTQSRNNASSSMNIPSNPNESVGNGRSPVNPAQLLLQHDYRLFQIEKLVKTIHENTSKEEEKDENRVNNTNMTIDMNEIKGEVSASMYESDKLKTVIKDEVRSVIEQSYDFDSFFENLQKLSEENSMLKDTIMSNQKYINDMNSVLIKLLSEFREVQSIIKNFKPTVLETIEEAEEIIENNSKKDSSESDEESNEESNDENSKESSIDEPEEESQEQSQEQ